MGNSISDGLDFRAALGQFGAAGSQLAQAFVKAPFTGGWQRLILVGPPVLLITSGVGALIFTVMHRTLLGISKAIYTEGKNLYKNFFKSRTVSYIRQEEQSNTAQGVQRRPQDGAPPPPDVAAQEDVAAQGEPPMLKPLPIDAAKERNESLIKLLDLAEKLMIDPLLERKTLVFGESYTAEGLKKWLRSMVLWRLGVAWDQLETHYVKVKTPPPPTHQSIITEAKQIDSTIGKTFEEAWRTGTIGSIIDVIRDSSLIQQKKERLAGLYFMLARIQQQPFASEDSKSAEEREIRKQFALTMNHGMATTLIHMTSIIEGWIAILNIPPVVLPPVLLASGAQQSEDVNPFSTLVKDISDSVRDELIETYLMPLWKIKAAEWDGAVKEALPPQSDRDHFETFMNCDMDEKTFLLDPKSHALSTALTSSVCLMRALRYMGHDPVRLAESTQNLLESLLTQLRPTLTDTLKKSADLLSQISFERTVPRVVDYYIEFLHFCTSVQKVQQASLSALEASAKDDVVQVDVLKKAGVTDADASQIMELFQQSFLHVSGKEIVGQLDEKSVHRVVRLSRHSPLQEARHEEGWIRITKERLKTILRIRAAEYAQEEGNWLSSFFKSNSPGKPKNLVGLLLDYSTKLRSVPGVEGVMTFLLAGVASILENEGCSVIQSFLNEFTSTGYLSTNIATSLVKGLLTKETAKWYQNLPTLQQAYLFLQPAEQKQVLKHLSFQYEGALFEQRKAELVGPPHDLNGRGAEIASMKQREDKYQASLEVLEKVLKEARKSSVLEEKELSRLSQVCQTIKREKELQQFDRAKALVTYVADYYFTELCDFTGGEVIKSIVLSVIREALNLLKYQEIVKHCIFTIVDLVIDELEESSNFNEKARTVSTTQTPSLLDFIDKQQQQRRLLNSLHILMVGAEKDKKGWARLGIEQFTGILKTWSPDVAWRSFYGHYATKVAITPVELTEKIVGRIAKFGQDPNGLSELIIRVLTANVADPRPHKK